MDKLIGQSIVDWYSINKRDLPWRNTRDPYLIWLSEVILQQTRVSQGLPYYQNFVSAYPTVELLASAKEQEVLNLWSGLGYYSRARNLLAAAKQVVAEFKGQFPTFYSDLIKLKGVGDYTASAIASFSSGEKVPVVDGNVFRVLSRIYNIENDIVQPASRAVFKDVGLALMGELPAEVFNQAIMEFGALQCTPAPNCMFCPVIENCKAYSLNLVGARPVKSKKKKAKEVYLHYFLIRNKNKIAVEKRLGKGIWENMYQLPMQEISKEAHANDGEKEFLWATKHQLTHRTIYARFYKAADLSQFGSHNMEWVSIKELSTLPFPRIFEIFFNFISIK